MLLQAEGEAAAARAVAAGLEERSASMTNANQELAHRVATLERMGADLLQQSSSGCGGLPMPIAGSPLLRELASCRQLAESY